jgi:transcriptional regulator with XRE-family HTH domain
VKVHWRDPYPDAAQLRRRISEAMGVHCTVQRFADLAGASRMSVMRWEQGGRVALMFRSRLLALERMLNEGTLSVEEAINGYERPRPPLVATSVSLMLEGAQALLRFGLAVPGDPAGRTAVEILVPQALIVTFLGPPPVARDPPSAALPEPK